MLDDLKFTYHLLKFAKDPENTTEVFRFTDSLLDMASRKDRENYGRRLLADPRTAEMYATRGKDYLRKPFDLTMLRQCPKGSLGQIYAERMDAANLNPEFFEYNKVTDVVSFFTLRLRKTHDIYHAVTGFETDVPSEIGLQAFYLGQLHFPVPMSIMVSALLWVISTRDPEIVQTTMEHIVRGYQLGRSAELLHGVVWEDLWHVDLAEVRRRLRITVPTVAEIKRVA